MVQNIVARNSKAYGMIIPVWVHEDSSAAKRGEEGKTTGTLLRHYGKAGGGEGHRIASTTKWSDGAKVGVKVVHLALTI